MCVAPDQSRMAVLGTHNLIAVVTWLVVFRRRRLPALVPLLSLVACVIALVSLPNLAGWWAPCLQRGDLDLVRVAAVNHGDRIARTSMRLFVFLQSIHYAIWLTIIPQEDVRGEGTLTFRMSVRSLFADFTSLGLVLIAVLVVFVGFGAMRNLQKTHDLLLTLATFHVYLELAVLAFLFACGTKTKERELST
ncbi:MAG: hypothetical protein NVS3B20_10460 [Polyangiales bacterium]